MHATTEELLEIKDNLQNAASGHVQSCEYCQAELQGLHALQQQITRSVEGQPDTKIWDRILRSAGAADLDSAAGEAVEQVPAALLAARSSAHQPSIFNSLHTAVYTLAASIALTGFIGLYIFSQQGSVNQHTALLQANIQELMIHSRGMEQALQKVAMQSEMLTSAQQSVSERLYWKLTYVDQMIHENNVNNQNDPERMEQLWNERID
ncbi:MAG: hypothetical protein HKN85_05235, partial [Gammaproteobacteria bacterium]|nr:hypothetical protein [Gammaproteobacteria bacterium]